MKDFKIAPEVAAQVKELIKALHEFCVENNVPVVVGAVLGRTHYGENVQVEKVRACFLSTASGAFDSTIAAAGEILKTPFIPDEVVSALAMKNMFDGNGDDCDCPNCVARRAAQAQDKSEGEQTH